MSGQRRTARDARRRSHGQNFLHDGRLARLIASTFGSGDLVLDLGARPKSPTDLRRPYLWGGPQTPGGPSPASPPAFLSHERPSALLPVLVDSAGSGPPGSPNLSPDFPATLLGAGRGAFTLPLAQRGARVVAVEADPEWARLLQETVAGAGLRSRVTVVPGDFLETPLPYEPYRVVSSVPFNRTTALLRRLLDDPERGPERCDLVVQWEVGRKRAAQPPTTLLSAGWAPWWRVDVVWPVPRTAFRPAPASARWEFAAYLESIWPARVW